MPDRVVLCDTSPFVYLYRIGSLDLLPQLYGKILIPAGVAEELLEGIQRGFSVPAVADLPWTLVRDIPSDQPLINVPDLGMGETQIISLAIRMRDCLVIMDDALGRTIARLNGIKVTGTVGVLLRAKRNGLISSVSEKLSALCASGFWLDDDTRRGILDQAGEK